MLITFLVLVFLIGISWGSFLNVWIYRIPEKRSVAAGRSACMTCNHTLSHWDLVPVFSFLFLRGKCRYCKTKLSWQYPAVEIIVGLLFLLTFYCFGLNPYLLALSAFLITVNVVVAKIDWNTTLIPNIISYPCIVISLVLAFFMEKMPLDNLVPQPTLYEALIGGAAYLIVFVILHFLSKGGMGIGDAKWALFMGLMLGWQYATVAIFIGTLLSVIFSGIIYVVSKSKIKKLPAKTVSLDDKEESAEPVEERILGVSLVNGKVATVLGPYLAIGMLITWFYGVQILDWWFGR